MLQWFKSKQYIIINSMGLNENNVLKLQIDLFKFKRPTDKSQDTKLLSQLKKYLKKRKKKQYST